MYCDPTKCGSFLCVGVGDRSAGGQQRKLVASGRAKSHQTKTIRKDGGTLTAK